jgi:hypothetical protein
MKDNLKDLIQHTHGIGGIELVKVDGTEQETKIAAITEDKSVIVYGTFKTPLADFVGTFGMPNLSKLNTIVEFEDYDDDAIINVTRKEDIPAAIHFETKIGDFVNDYRLMAKVIVEDKIKNVAFKGATWNIEFEPQIANIQRLKKQASANSEELFFTFKSDKGDLKIFFGDHSTHSGNFVFQAAVSGTLTRNNLQLPVKAFLSIMTLQGDKTVRISDQGVVEVVVDSGLATYRYLLPSQAK